MPPIATEAEEVLRDWLERAQQEMIPEPIIVDQTTITYADATSASIRIKLAGDFDQATLELCARTVVQAFALTRTSTTTVIDHVSCEILERPKGRTLWAETIILDRRGTGRRYAVDVIDERDCRVGAGVVSLSVEGGRLT